MSLSSSQVWKLGWSPKPGGDFGTVFPEIPVEFLQEKEVFKEFIYRINTLGSPGLPSGVVTRHHACPGGARAAVVGPVFSFYSTKELRHNIIVNTFCNVHKAVTVKSLIQVCVCVCEFNAKFSCVRLVSGQEGYPSN